VSRGTCESKKLLVQETFVRNFQMCYKFNDSCLFGICRLQRVVSGAITATIRDAHIILHIISARRHAVSGLLLCCISPAESDVSRLIHVDCMIKCIMQQSCFPWEVWKKSSLDDFWLIS